MSQPGGQRFHIEFSGELGKLIRALQRHASKAGIGQEFLAALRAIVDQLETQPDQAGEPLYRLPVLRMQVRCIANRPVLVDYAVCEDRPVVYLMQVKLL